MSVFIGKKAMRKILAAVLTLCILGYGSIYIKGAMEKQNTEAASAEGSWGLSFQSEGGLPAGNASADYLKKYNAYYVGNPEEKSIYLTFDAGYDNGYTGHILDVLKKHNIKAAFFVVGNLIKDNPELIKRMAEEGHIVGNHTFTHPDMSAISDKEAFEAELGRLETAYKEAVGNDMSKFYRPPQGRYSESNLAMAKELGYTTVFWSLAYVDWYENDQPTKQTADEKLTKRLHNGAVVLLHSTSKTNSDILDELLTQWEKLGYSFKTLDELGKQS